MRERSGWENFYMFVGSSAGALIGWQFVVITLIADQSYPIADDLTRIHPGLPILSLSNP